MTTKEQLRVLDDTYAMSLRYSFELLFEKRINYTELIRIQKILQKCYEEQKSEILLNQYFAPILERMNTMLNKTAVAVHEEFFNLYQPKQRKDLSCEQKASI